MRILADAEATSPSPGSHGGTARCRRSLTTTYYRRRTEEMLQQVPDLGREPMRIKHNATKEQLALSQPR